MPKPKKDENRSSYISRCIEQVRSEEPKKPTKEVAGKCYGMWRTYTGEED